MFETGPEKPSRFNLQVFLGFLLGVVASLACLFLTIFLGFTLGANRTGIYPIFVAVGLIAALILALRNMRKSSYAFGAVIALSLALLTDAACAVALFR
jgi:hypothetical protein